MFDLVYVVFVLSLVLYCYIAIHMLVISYFCSLVSVQSFVTTPCSRLHTDYFSALNPNATIDVTVCSRIQRDPIKTLPVIDATAYLLVSKWTVSSIYLTLLEIGTIF